MIYRIALHLKIKYLLQRRCNVTFPYLQIHLISSSIYPPSCLSYPLLYISHTVSLCVHLRRSGVCFPYFPPFCRPFAPRWKMRSWKRLQAKEENCPELATTFRDFRICLALHYFLWIPLWIFLQEERIHE